MKLGEKILLFCGFSLCITILANLAPVYAAEQKTMNPADTGLGGMSVAINGYYDEILEQDGISVNNVTTTLSIDGQVLEKVDRIPAYFHNIAFAKVNEYVNIRKEPTVDSEPVGRLYSNAAATVLSEKDGWTKVSSGKITGYIKSEYLSTGEKAVAIAEKKYTKYAKVTAETLTVYEKADAASKSLSTVTKDTKLKVATEEGEWVKVSSGSVNGYLQKSYVDYIYNFKYATSMEEAKKLDEKKQSDINNMIWPLPSDHHIYTYFGRRKAPCAGASTYHKGLDIGGAYGSKVVAVLSGTVTAAAYSSSGGYYVEIDHGNGYKTRYLHNSKLLVKKGQKVTQGDVISLVGSTGISTGSHLHFSLLKNGVNINPYPFLKKVH